LPHVCWAEHDLVNWASVELAVIEWITTDIWSIFTFLDVICADKCLGAGEELTIVKHVATNKWSAFALTQVSSASFWLWVRARVESTVDGGIATQCQSTLANLYVCCTDKLVFFWALVEMAFVLGIPTHICSIGTFLYV
jgi:hypothetical protein